MAFNIKPSLDAVRNAISKTGQVSAVDIGEPTASPDAKVKPYAAVWFKDSVVVDMFADNSTRELQILFVRMYFDAFVQPASIGETALAVAASDLGEALAADPTLSGTIQRIDLAAELGTNYEAKSGYADVGGTTFHVIDITLPLIVLGSATLA